MIGQSPDNPGALVHKAAAVSCRSSPVMAVTIVPRDVYTRFLPVGTDEVSGGQGFGLRSGMGLPITTDLEDETVVEIILNPDGTLWIKRRSADWISSGKTLSTANAEQIIRSVALQTKQNLHKGRSIVSARLPKTGEYFEGVLPPIVPRPTFAIRKPSVAPYALDNYVQAGKMSDRHADILRHAVASHANILIVGDKSTGKTTLANALLDEIAVTCDRVVIVEEVGELRYTSYDFISLRLADSTVSMIDLLRIGRRLRPDRIVIGEISGREAIEILEAWSTSHPGGVTTLRAESAIEGLHRLERLIEGGGVATPRSLIAEAIDIVVFLSDRKSKHRIEMIGDLVGLDGSDYRLNISQAPNFSRH